MLFTHFARGVQICNHHVRLSAYGCKCNCTEGEDNCWKYCTCQVLIQIQIFLWCRLKGLRFSGETWLTANPVINQWCMYNTHIMLKDFLHNKDIVRHSKHRWLQKSITTTAVKKLLVSTRNELAMTFINVCVMADAATF